MNKCSSTGDDRDNKALRGLKRFYSVTFMEVTSMVTGIIIIYINNN